MFIVIQFPFTDIRSFLDIETYKLKYPDLKNTDPYKHEFIRCFGPLKNRYNPLKFQPDEAAYIKANRAIRLHRIEKYRFSNENFILQSRFRRFYSNSSNCRVELGFKNLNSIIFTSNEFFQMLNDFLNIPVVIPSNKERPSCKKEKGHLKSFAKFLFNGFNSQVANHNLNMQNSNCKLINSSTELAPLYLHATTKYPVRRPSNLDEKWILPGRPIILVEYYKCEVPKLPTFIESVHSINQHGINLYHTIINNKDSNVMTRVWLIEKNDSYKGSKNDKEYVRKLRINLLRLHSEQESLKKVLTAIDDDIIKINVKDETDTLQKYLNNTIKSISKDTRYGLPHVDIVNLVNSFENIVNPCERENILDRVKNIRPSIYKKVDDYTEIKNTNQNQNTYICYNNNTNVTITDATIGSGNIIGGIKNG